MAALNINTEKARAEVTPANMASGRVNMNRKGTTRPCTGLMRAILFN